MKISSNRSQNLIGLILGLSWFAACMTGGAVLLSLLYKKMPELADALVPIYIAAWIATLFLGRMLISNVLGLIVHGGRSPSTSTSITVEHQTPWNISVGYFDQVQSTTSAVDPNIYNGYIDRQRLIEYELGGST